MVRRLAAALAIVVLLGNLSAGRADDAARPNVLWITCEDIGPHLGCYGDAYAVTPNLDRLAARGLRYLNVWSNAPVCAPARTTIISGMYATSTGAEHMRSLVPLPAGMKMYPQYLREAGYYCTNNSKEDYNLEKPGRVWNESSAKAHWKNRKPGQPFFAVFNLLITHESQIRTRPHRLVHDPAKAPLPAYHPDTPEVRQDWAQYYDNITTMDGQVGALLRELEDAGLADDTIVFFYADHGSGMPRSKRFPYNSGLSVPLLVAIPEKFRHLAPKEYAPGGKTDRLVSFVDLAPTLLSLAGVRPPDTFQGRAFLGKYEAPPREYLFGFRGRMDERYDLIRSARDQHYVYLRNYLPHKIYGQYIDYMFQTPTTRVWKRLYDEGRLKPPQTYFWEPKPPEELYDLRNDPDEVRNLASDPEHQETLKRLRQAQRELVLQIRDIGFLPEDEIHRRAQGSTPYEVGHDDARYPLRRILAAAELASSLRPDTVAELRRDLADADSAVRYWGALGLRMRGREAVAAGREELRRALADEVPSVRIAAGEALGKYGTADERRHALDVLLQLAPLEGNGVYVSMEALNALDELGPNAAPGLEVIQGAAKGATAVNARMKDNVPHLVEEIATRLRK
jgi:uncharacterized sulfatase